MKPLSDKRVEQIAERPMFHPFRDTANCIKWLALEVIRLRKENGRMANWIAQHTVSEGRDGR